MYQVTAHRLGAAVVEHGSQTCRDKQHWRCDWQLLRAICRPNASGIISATSQKFDFENLNRFVAPPLLRRERAGVYDEPLGNVGPRSSCNHTRDRLLARLQS